MPRPAMAYAYDEIAYPGYAFPQTHPDRLATNARLFGLEAAAVERCRVLEIGCGDGGNLLPMAYGLPGSEFVGIDLAARAIGAAQETAAALALRNVAFRRLDLTQLPTDLGPFDYIVAHGVYSWVPPEVRDALLAACGRHLAPNGVAFVSYNALPGGHVRRMVREMMLYHVHRAPDSRTRIAQSVALVKFLADSVPPEDEYGALLKKELERVTRHDAGYVFHDDLAEVNEPVYFNQFAEHAARHGLQFLAEADYFSMDLRHLPAAARESLATLGENVLAREQYLDFLKCRRFRQTLLCRQEVRLEHPASPARLEPLFFSSSAKPESPEPTVAQGVEEVFTGARNATLRTDFALGKTALLELAEAWPRRLAFDELAAAVTARLRASGQEADTAPLAIFLLEAYGLGVLEVHAHRPAVTLTPGERPRASALARRQAAAGRFVTSLLHVTIKLDGDAACALVRALDGTRSREALAAELSRTDPASPFTPEAVDQNLGALARLGLLEA